MWRHINKGRHNNLSIPGIHFGKTSETWEIEFHSSCRYDLVGNDQYDINKLFGWSYGLHHTNSFRIGWRYNIDKDCMDLFSYTYRNKVRTMVYIAEVPIGKRFGIQIFEYDELLMMLIDSFWFHQEPKFNNKWGYNLDLYFGGDKKAPHNMKVWMRRLK